jgi:dUTP diphosphatase
MELPFRRLPGNDLPLPSYATLHASGMDLRASQDHAISPGERVAVGTGFELAIPEGYEGQVRMRSGLALKHGLVVPNSPGTIDSDYRAELKVIIMNLGAETFHISRGDRVAQLVITPVQRISPIEVTELSETARGEGGFGHTGVR